MNKKFDISYIECAGVRVPSNWSVGQLAEALAKRKIRFNNEQEIMAVFGDAIKLKRSLEQGIQNLQNELSTWEHYVKQKKEKVMCPGCGLKWTEPNATAPSATRDKEHV